MTATQLVPVFPLPGVVFFPDTELPLHIFEERYREMVRDAATGEGLIAMALPKPGWETHYLGSPDFHRIGTLGRIENLVGLPDGRSNLRLVGLQRVEYREMPSDRAYRLVRWRARPEPAVDEHDPRVRRAKLELLACFGYLQQALEDSAPPSIVLDEGTSFPRAVNQCCALLPVEPALRQELLEVNDLLERQRRVAQWTERLLERVIRLRSTGADPGN
jgi:Lon protease-like protein